MIKIPKVNNYKEYILSNGGIDVLYLNGKVERVISNNTLKAKFETMNWTLSPDGDIIQNNKNKKDNTSETTDSNTKGTTPKASTKPKPTTRPKAKPKPKVKPKAKTSAK